MAKKPNITKGPVHQTPENTAEPNVSLPSVDDPSSLPGETASDRRDRLVVEKDTTVPAVGLSITTLLWENLYFEIGGPIRSVATGNVMRALEKYIVKKINPRYTVRSGDEDSVQKGYTILIGSKNTGLEDRYMAIDLENGTMIEFVS